MTDLYFETTITRARAALAGFDYTAKEVDGSCGKTRVIVENVKDSDVRNVEKCFSIFMY